MNKVYQSLKSIIDECYRAFEKYPTPQPPLNICYECCVSPKIANDLVTLPLKELTQKQLYEYNTSAKNSEENPNEIKYFLPRMIELFVQGEELYHSTELNFVRVENCAKDSFSPKELAVWQKFADAYLDEILKVYCWETEAVFSQYIDILTTLLIFHKAHIDIQPFLQRWRDTETPQAIIHYIDSTYSWWCHGFTSNFAHDKPTYEEIVTNWLFDKDNRDYFIEQILNLDSGITQQYCKSNEIYTDIEHLFDLITCNLKD